MFAAKNLLLTPPSATVSAVTFQGANAADGTTVTIPTHAVGQIIVIWAKDGTSTAPTPPSAGGTVPAWSLIESGTGSTMGSGLWYFIATATNHTSGTWTNADAMAAVVCSGQSSSTPIGGHARVNTASENNQTTAPAITLAQTDGTSAILHFFGQYWDQTWSTAPAGYTTRAPASGTHKSCVDTKNSTTSDGSVAQGRDGGSFDTVGATLEIRAH